MLVWVLQLDRCKSCSTHSSVVVFFIHQKQGTMFRKLFQWAKSLFASESKYEAQTTATENEVQNPASTPKSASSLAPSDWERIEQAMEQDLPLTCQVLACKKGGYTVSVLDTYAFLPNTLTHYYRPCTGQAAESACAFCQEHTNHGVAQRVSR